MMMRYQGPTMTHSVRYNRDHTTLLHLLRRFDAGEKPTAALFRGPNRIDLRALLRPDEAGKPTASCAALCKFFGTIPEVAKLAGSLDAECSDVVFALVSLCEARTNSRAAALARSVLGDAVPYRCGSTMKALGLSLPRGWKFATRIEATDPQVDMRGGIRTSQREWLPSTARRADQPRSPPAPLHVDVNLLNDTKAAHLGTFIAEALEACGVSSMTATALYEDYCRWCEATDIEPLSLSYFGRMFGQSTSIAKRKIAGRVRYIGVALRRVPPEA